MEQTATTRSRPRVRRQKKGCCDELQCESGLRNNYYEGKRLTTDMFRVEQRYFVERRRLLNRALYGWGVVYGYGLVTGKPKDGADGRISRRHRILPGLAFDACGRELLQIGDLKLDLDDVTVIDKDGKMLDRDDAFKNDGGGHKDRDICWQLSVHYAEQRDGHVTIPDPCDCDRQEWDRVCETVRYTLQRIDCDDCCVDDDCGLDCGCGTGHCCDPKRTQRPVPPTHSKISTPDQRKVETRAERAGRLEKLDPGAARGSDEAKDEREDETGDSQKRPKLPFRRGGCRCVCDHLSDMDVEDTCTTRLVEIEEACGRVYVDLKHGVPIACLGLVPDYCGGWTFGETVDACGPRRLIKRNDVLFDLIRGCDLTRISGFGWAPWHRQTTAVKFDEFADAFTEIRGDKAKEYVTNDFWVEFSRPVHEDTLLPDCFEMTVLGRDREGGWLKPRRVPVVRIDTDKIAAQPDDPPKHVRSARLVVEGRWFRDAVVGGWTGFQGDDSRVEIEVRGDFIIDCNGQPIDANAVGLLRSNGRPGDTKTAVDPLEGSTGNGTPGGTFLSTFRVGSSDGSDYAERRQELRHERIQRYRQQLEGEVDAGATPVRAGDAPAA